MPLERCSQSLLVFLPMLSSLDMSGLAMGIISGIVFWREGEYKALTQTWCKLLDAIFPERLSAIEAMTLWGRDRRVESSNA